MSQVELSIIVVSYNTRQMTLDCIESVYQQTTATSFELLVYDNASADGSAEAIAEKYPDVKLIAAKDNIGFAMGNNAAIEHAVGDFVLLLNPDTVVLDGAIDKLMAFAAASPEFGIWGGKTLFGDHSLNPNSCFAKMTVWNQFCRASGLAAVFKHSSLFNPEHYGGWQRDSVRQVDIVCGCFLLVRRELWNELGGFAKKYFMYAEEADLCLRAKARGWKPAVTPEAVIVHYGGGSEKIREDKMVRLLSAKSELLKDHWSSLTQPLGRWMLKLWVINRVIAYSVASLLPGSGSSRRDALNTWKGIWRRHPEWEYGYTGKNG